MIKVERFVNQLMTSNCYIVVDEESKHCLCIDPASEKSECEIAYLGNGFSDEINLCDNLICTKCDCKVSIFKNYMWDIDVDYLFFRNNFATPEKLKQKLVESYGTYAYSCQCSWQNISDESVPAIKVSNWVCGGHKI